MFCSRCQGQNPDDLNYCGHCGANLRPSCPNCGQALPGGVEICTNCGYRPPSETHQGPKEKNTTWASVSSRTPASSPSQMECSSCGYNNRPGIRFCEKCGQPISISAQPGTGNIVCHNCGSANRPGVQFCEQCGASLYLGDQKKRGQKDVPKRPLWLRGIGRFAIGSICGFVSTKLGLVLVNYLIGQK